MSATSKTWHMTIRLLVVVVAALVTIPAATAQDPDRGHTVQMHRGKVRSEMSGIYVYRNGVDSSASAAATAFRTPVTPQVRPEEAGIHITECPQAGRSTGPQPLDMREVDQVEQLSDDGDDRRVNQDYSCFPQNETSIAANPVAQRNLVGGANDYRLGWGSSGFYASTDHGATWYDGILPFPSLPSGDNLDGGGDPALAFDREGVVYYASINFNRTDDTNGIFVNRSTNGGFTWNRPCVPIILDPPTDDQAICGGQGDVRQPGDGVITFLEDDDTELNGSVAFNDKEYIAVGPRPEGVKPVCFGAETRKALPCNPALVGSDRIYVTWSLFSAATETDAYSRILLSYSDDQGRSWSPPKAISGSAPFCVGSPENRCDFNQGSVPTVSPATGYLYVAWLNGNTPDEDQYLMARSDDGGQTFEGPFFITPVFDVNYPRAVNGRTDCIPRGQGATRAVLTNSCFRVNSYGNMVVDKRGGQYANDLYVVISDNRNGTIASSNTDIFLFKSVDGGLTWYGPTRVNTDRSVAPDNRDCGRNPQGISGNPALCGGAINYGNDQWFPWVDINVEGDLNIVFNDRRLDRASSATEWPDSRQRPGNYLAWFWGAQCRVQRASSRECVSENAGIIRQPTGPVDPGEDPVPGQNQRDRPFRNFAISDVPSNYDYAFRAGIFMGDYNNVAVTQTTAYGFWTDARNGRSTRSQRGRNPICEQSDVFLDSYSTRMATSNVTARATDRLFLVTQCPATPEPYPGP